MIAPAGRLDIPVMLIIEGSGGVAKPDVNPDSNPPAPDVICPLRPYVPVLTMRGLVALLLFRLAPTAAAIPIPDLILLEEWNMSAFGHKSFGARFKNSNSGLCYHKKNKSLFVNHKSHG